MQNTSEGDHYLLLQSVEDGVSWRNVVLARDGGSVGIGTTAPAYKLDINGTVASIDGFLYTSDARYKTNVKELSNSLTNLLKLKGVSYNWKQEEFKEKNFRDGLQIGVIAQEVEKIYPELVSTDANGYKAIDYAKFTPIVIEAIKEQQKMIEEQNHNIQQLQDEINKLKRNCNL